MKNVIITGASGMIGNLILQHCLHDPEIDRITSFVRLPSGIKNDKLTEIIITDFCNYSGLEQYFHNQHIAYYCIGVYTGAVPDKKFKEITVDYTVKFAKILKDQSPNAIFCFLSGAGADQKEKSRMPFALYKGMAENYLITKDFGATYIFRPSYIYPVEKRKEPNFSYRLSRKLYPIIKLFGDNYSIKSIDLAETIYKVGLIGTSKTILENKDIYKIFNSIKRL